MLAFRQGPGPAPPDRVVLAESVLAVSLGIVAGVLAFGREASVVGVFLTALAQAGTVERLLDRNRAQIWEGGVPPRRANLQLAQSLTVLFLGVFATYVAAVQLTPEERVNAWFERQLGSFLAGSMREVAFGSVSALLERNALVLVACFAVAFVYRHGGMLLVLAWNASRWGVIFSYVARTAALDEGDSVASHLLRTLAAILPHLLFEAVAYVLVAMAGVFLSKALEKYPIGSAPFRQVGRAVGRLVAVGALTLAAAAALEAWVAPRLVAALF